MAVVMKNVTLMKKLIKAFETLNMADPASQQRVLDVWIAQDTYSLETVSQTPSGAELMEVYVRPAGWSLFALRSQDSLIKSF